MPSNHWHFCIRRRHQAFAAEDLGVEMPMTAAASGVYHDALTQGFGGEDFYATLKVLEGRAGVSVPALGKPQPST